ncbi:MAG: ATP-binding protein [Bacteroidota bacterium]
MAKQKTIQEVLEEKVNLLEWELNRLKLDNEKLSQQLTLSRISEFTTKANENRLKLIVENLPLPVFLKDQDSVYVLANRKYIEMVNSDMANFEGKTDFDFYPVDLAEKYRADDARILQDGQTVSYEEDFVENGVTKSVLTTKMPFIDPETGKRGLLGIFIDNTERKRNLIESESARNKAEQADNLKSAFLANMARELRSPLNAVSGFAQLLEHPDISEEKRKEYIYLINKRGSDLLNIVNDIVDISQLEAGKTSLNENLGDINDLFTELFENFSSGTKYEFLKSVELKIGKHLPCKKTFVYADFGKLRQILTHLLDNAVKFTEKGRIEFGCELIGDQLEFYVSDTGIGISEEKRHLLFDHLKPGKENFLSSKAQGAMLGLAICRKMLELMNGRIEVTSKVGEGSEFRFTIPYKAAQDAETPESFFNTIDDWAKKTIMVVEDNHFNCEFLAAVLRRTNANFSVAYDGETALKIFRETPGLDIVLMDIRLPDINGFELTQIMKAIRPDVKIIAITAYASEDDRQYSVDVGCDAFIPKPVDINVLLRTIEKYFVVPSASEARLSSATSH